MEAGDRARLGQEAGEILRVDVELMLSGTSIWEMCIKVSQGRLSFEDSVERIVESHVANGLVLLPIEIKTLYAIETLPLHHKDPFDRLIVAQALAIDLPLLSPDAAFDRYGITRIW